MEKIFLIHCADSYEAEKLASLLSGGREDNPGVRAVSAVHGNEMVLRLTDQSSHSVMLKDAATAKDCREVFKVMLNKGARVKRTEQIGNAVELELQD